MTVKTDPILKKFGKKTVYQKTRLEGSDDHLKKMKETKGLKSDFVNSLAQVPHDLLSVLNKYSSNLQELSFNDRMDYLLHSMVCKFNSFISFMIKGDKLSSLSLNTRNLLIRRGALLNAYLIFAIRYRKQDGTITFPDMMRMPVSFFMSLFKDPAHCNSTMQWIDWFIS